MKTPERKPGRDGRGKFQGRTQKRFLQGLAVGRIVCGISGGIVKQQRLIGMPVIVVFRGKDAPVSRRYAVEIFCFFHDHAERVALPGIGVEIQVVPENLCEAVGQLRRLTGVGDGVEQGIANFSADGFDIRARRNGVDRRGKTSFSGFHLQHPARIDLVTDSAELPGHRAADEQAVARADVAQIIDRLCRSDDIGDRRGLNSGHLERFGECFAR